MSTTTDLRVPTGRVDLFTCPVWHSRLEMTDRYVAAIVADIDVRLATYRAPGVAGQHTGSVFQERPEAHWRAYHDALFQVTDALALDLDEPWSERFVRTWGVRYDDLGDYRLGDTHLHSHMGKTYASVLLLDHATDGSAAAPGANDRTDDGATLLRNPQANLAGITASALDHRGPTTPRHGIIFPGPIEHQALPPHPGVDRVARRIVLVSDVAYY
jgi:hypothetical protein